MTYEDLMKAANILGDARRAIGKVDGPGIISPAWVMVHHALDYVTQQATAALRGEA